MTGVRRAYSSTVVAAGHLAACAVLAAALLSCGIAFLPTGAAAATAVDAAVIVLAGLQMATVRLSDGECIRVSTPDPAAAALLITGRGHGETGEAGGGDEDKDAQRGEHRA